MHNNFCSNGKNNTVWICWGVYSSAENMLNYFSHIMVKNVISIYINILLEAMRLSFHLWVEEAYSSVWPAEWIGYDITTVGQCSWLVPGKGEHVHPGVKSIGHPDNLCQHLLFDFCSTSHFTFSLKCKTSLNEHSSLDQPRLKSKYFSLPPSFPPTICNLSPWGSSIFASHAFVLLSRSSSHHSTCRSSRWDVYFEVCSPRPG